jgi:hypothetical protein
MFEKHGVHSVQEFSASMYKQYGVRVVILAGYMDAENDPTMTLYV